ncbi:phage repressor protein C with HTH and peptisase S24 domain [Paraburkholderia tropica]|uniref:Phage repressor protein C with HTH and peptisase S24 domain n=2 Tax=Paraburkholderia tropica TaxID=92647 RepID=A0ABX5MPD9_9BURK|nr:phage repressor protein C with HTH and peptisase S24 domain [Paraburkholderia tropica]PZW79551.1 phage repressor protein C with HTH and peptisase S24 domain [Paraburkholderia tropica]
MAKGVKSQSALSRASGVPQPTINRILKGTTPNPDLSTVQKLCDALGVSVEWLTGRADYRGTSVAKRTERDPGLSYRIQQILDETGINVDQLAEAAGLSPAIIAEIRANGILSLDAAVSIQERYGYNAVWLVLGKGEKKSANIHHEDPFDPIPLPTGRRIPVVGTAQLGDNGHWAELDYPVGHGDGYLDFPSRDKDAYGVRCKGDSMTPRIKDGEFVVVEPNRKVEHGDEVLVKAKDGRVMIKLYLYAAQGRTHFMSVNAAHMPIAIDSDQIERLHFVAAIVKPSMWLFG